MSSEKNILLETNLNTEFRCPNCHLIPLINLETINKELKMKFKCINKNCQKEFFDNYQILNNKCKKNSISFVTCSNCKKKRNIISKKLNNFYYCFECFNFFCSDCFNIHENKNHKIIELKKMDSICAEHNLNFNNFCEFHQINLCNQCKDSDNKNFIKINCLEKYKLNKFNNIILTNEKNFNELQNLFEIFKFTFEKFEKLFINFLENEKNKIQFMKDLFQFYKLLENDKNINFQILNNLDKNIEKNYEKLNIFNIDLNNQIKNLNDIILNIENLNNSNINLNENNNNIKNNNNTKSNDKFKIENFNIYKNINTNKSEILCLQKLEDGRFASSDTNSNIIIYNNETFEPEINIENNSGKITYFIQLNNKNIVAAFYNFKFSTLKIIKIINKKDFEIIQNIQKPHSKLIFNLIQLKENNFISFSWDNSFKFWSLNNKNNLFKSTLTKKENNPLYNAIQTKENELLYEIPDSSTIIFFDLNKNEKITTLNNLNLINFFYGKRMEKLNDKEIILAGNKIIYLIDVINYQILNKIETNDINVCIINIKNETFLSSSNNGIITQYKIQNRKFIKESLKNFKFENNINSMIFLDNKIIIGKNDITILKK